MTTECGPRTWADEFRLPSTIEREARRQQAEMLASGLRRAASALWRAGSAVATVTGRILAPISWRLRRRSAIADLSGLDARMLADIGLQRGDIELAVDGHLVDDRVRHPRTARTAKPIQVPQLRPDLAPEAAANRNPTLPAALAHAS